jgi:hypothetical protein
MGMVWLAVTARNILTVAGWLLYHIAIVIVIAIVTVTVTVTVTVIVVLLLQQHKEDVLLETIVELENHNVWVRQITPHTILPCADPTQSLHTMVTSEAQALLSC